MRDSDSADWIEHQSGLSSEVAQRLLESDELSRREVLDDGMLICFHTRKIRPVAGENDSASQRIWIERDRIITVRSESNLAVDALQAVATEKGRHWEPYLILTFLIRASVKQLEPLISGIVSETGRLEDQSLDADAESGDDELDVVRRQTMRARRHFVVMRNLLAFINSDDSLIISKQERLALESTKYQVQGYLESLEDCHERTQMLQDQVESRMAARLNRITYNLTVVATVFLPLSFLTGLMGMSVAGIPDAHNPWAFAIICVIMVITAIISWLFLRWRRWI